jgi:hypothetical protein
MSAQIGPGGIPFYNIATSLDAEGVHEKAVMTGLWVATRGEISVCEACGFPTKATLAFCYGCCGPSKPVAHS